MFLRALRFLSQLVVDFSHLRSEHLILFDLCHQVHLTGSKCLLKHPSFLEFRSLMLFEIPNVTEQRLALQLVLQHAVLQLAFGLLSS